jgi:hypothetical protein
MMEGEVVPAFVLRDAHMRALLRVKALSMKALPMTSS